MHTNTRWLILPLLVAPVLVGVSPPATVATRPKPAATFTGKATRIIDGDTVEVLVGKRPVRVRLHGIDAPESGQAFGTRARQALGDLVAGKLVGVRRTDTDRYGRTVGVILLDGRDINRELLRAGWAWHFTKYDQSESYAAAEKKARAFRAGLWAGDNVVPPWEYRAGKRDPEANTVEPGPVGNPTGFWLNASSNVRHNAKCEHYGRTKRGRYCGAADGKACGICGG